MIKNKIMIAALAIFGLTSCSNDKDNVKTQETNLLVTLDVSSHVTRGVIEGTSDETPEVTSAIAYILSNGNVINQKAFEIKDENKTGPFETVFDKVLLGGNEKVVVAINKDQVSPKDLEVKAIQPTAGVPAKGNVYYFSKAVDIVSAGELSADKKMYTVNVGNIDPVAARVEVSGKVVGHKDFVKSVTVDVITPNLYSAKYANTEKFVAKTTENGDLWLNLDTTAQTSIENGEKVVANHLFAGDEQRIAFRIDAVNYKLRQENNANIKVKIADVEYFVYVGTEEGKEYVRKSDKFYALTFEGETKVPTMGAEATDDLIATYNTAKADKKGGYFSLVKFEDSKKESDNKNYEAGNIYKISLGKIDWNGDGKYDESDVYNPTENGDGSDEPSALEVGLTVQATVAKWIVKNVVPGVE